MKKIEHTIICFFIFILSFPLCAQNSPESRANAIRINESYIYGEGFGKTQKEADEQAFRSLSSSISTYVCDVVVIQLSDDEKMSFNNSLILIQKQARLPIYPMQGKSL